MNEDITMINKVLLLEDNIFKTADITRALEQYGITGLHKVRNQEDGKERLLEAIKQKKPYDLIITDMNYPLESGKETDPEAGFKLLLWLKAKRIVTPVIICSSYQYREPSVLGCNWYHKNGDLYSAFKELLDSYNNVIAQ